MASVSLRDLGLDRLSIEERLQLAEAIWDSVANPDAVRRWGDVEAEALARAKR